MSGEADQNVARTLMVGEWTNALGFAVLGRLCDRLLDAGTSSDPTGAARLRQIGSHARADQLQQMTMVTRDTLLHVMSPRSSRRPREVIDLDAVFASVDEVLRGQAPRPRTFTRCAAPESADRPRPSSRRAAPSSLATTKKRARTRSARTVGR